MRTRNLLLCLFCVLNAAAQLPSDFRTEQIYLNPQKHAYMPGDTIDLEGMVTCLATDQSVPFSNYLYIECFDEADSVLVRQKVSCKDEGYFNTRIPTDYLWPAGVYYLRAYTQLMRSFSPESFAQRAFLLAKEFPKKEDRVYEARCTIVPSGGKLIPGFMQTATVWLTDECSFPVSAELLLMDEQGDTIAPVQTSASGIAALSFIPRARGKYHLKTRIDETDYQFPLPELATGVKIQGTLNGKRLNYQVLNGEADLSAYRLYTFDRMNGLSTFAEVKPQGIVQLENAPAVMTLFLTDANHQILSEATVAPRYLMEGSLQAPDTVAVGESIRYELAELPEGSKVMTRVVADNDLLVTHAETELNYQSDYDSPLPFPAQMYSQDAAGRNRDVYAWLATATFKRFNLSDALSKGIGIYTYLPEDVLSFTGWIEKKTLRPMANGQLVAYHTENDFVYDVNLDEGGRFRIAVDDFWDGERFFLQAVTPKGKPDFANYHVDDETFPALANYRRFVLPNSRYAETEVIVGNTLDLKYTVGKDKVRNYTLPNVTVKARLKTEKDVPTNKFYSTNFKDQEEIEERAFGTLYDILRDMPGVTIRQVEDTGSDSESDNGVIESIIATSWGSNRPSKGGDGSGKTAGRKWEILTNRGASLLKGNSIPILVDGAKFTEQDYDFILFMPAFEIESVELLRAWQTLAYVTGAIDGAIMVKTRGYKEREPLPSKGAMYTPTGLSKLGGTMKEHQWVADKPGAYRLIVDVFSPEGIQSYEHRFEVVE